jgi:hypothetical protein
MQLTLPHRTKAGNTDAPTNAGPGKQSRRPPAAAPTIAIITPSYACSVYMCEQASGSLQQPICVFISEQNLNAEQPY